MPAPVLQSFAQAVYGELGPLAVEDEVNDWALAYYIGAFGAMFQEVEDYARDATTGEPGWSQVVDPDRTPAKALPWLGQFVGVRLPKGIDAATGRTRIKNAEGWNRGSVSAFVNAAQLHLTGSKLVVVRERDAAAYPLDPAYGLTVITYQVQTPNSAKVLEALLSQKPGGILMTYTVLVGQDFQQLLDTHPTFQDVYSDYATFQGVFNDQPGT